MQEEDGKSYQDQPCQWDAPPLPNTSAAAFHGILQEAEAMVGPWWPSAVAVPVLNLKVNEGGKSNHILQENKSPLHWGFHIQLHPTVAEDAQAGLSHVVTVLHLQ